MMERPKILKLLLLFMVLMLLNPKIECQVIVRTPITPCPRPLCISQFALANTACSQVPFNPSPPPAPPSPPPTPLPPSPPGPPHRQHHHGHHRHHEGTVVEQNCCHWLTAIDLECVCDVLVHLPPFLSRPMHQYTVSVGEVCSTTFVCSSRIQQ